MLIRILLVDDNPGDARLLREMLNDDYKTDYDLTHVQRLQDALTEAKSNTFDLILLDLSLPDSSGSETVIKANQELSNIPIIVLSGAADEDVAITTVQAGAQDYLVKGKIDNAIVSRAIRYAIERFNIQQALQKSEERYSLAVAGARDGIWDWDFETNRIYFSSRWKTILGFNDNDISDSPDEWLDRVHPKDLTQLLFKLDAHRKGKSKYFEHEYRMQNQDKSYRWMLARGVALYDSNGNAYRMAGSQSDITQRHKAEEKLLHEAVHDALTSLPNRKYIMRLLTQALSRSRNDENYHTGILFIDMDRYKIINDSLGHTIGDQLLIAFARRLKCCLRPGDTVARLGGDEFTVFMDNLSGIRDATFIAKRILKEVAKPFKLSGHEIHITTSIGIVLSSADYKTPEEILRDADIAMYQAKSNGKGQYKIFDQGMYSKAVAQMSLETDLRYALERGHLEVHYQPIISIARNSITGFEALARWRRNGKYIPPDQFIPAAEESGLIMMVGKQVMLTACRQLSTWQKQEIANKDLTISINISTKQLANPSFVKNIETILTDTELDGKNLHLEITESAILENSRSINQNLNHLKECGIGLSMDDFGTGYASLSNLHRLPFDMLKVDRSFISGKLPDNHKKDNIELVHTVITMAHNLGMNVIAEGVENKESLECLQRFECEYAQGYYFSPAVNGDTAAKMLSNHQYF